MKTPTRVDRGLSMSVTTWGAAVCAALVVTGSIAPWATNGQDYLSGVHGDGAITLVVGLLGLTAASARVSNFPGSLVFSWPVIVWLAISGLISTAQWTGAVWFLSWKTSHLHMGSSQFWPGFGVAVVATPSLFGSALAAASFAFDRRRGRKSSW